jgi:hypothetical protein
MARKSETNAKVIVAIFSLCIGIIATVSFDYFKSKDLSIGNVQKYENVFLFIRSKPVTNNYIILENVYTNVLTRAVESGTGKKGWDIFKKVGESLFKDMSFETRLDEIITAAKAKHPNVDGLIFSNDLTECQLIEFK